MLDLEYLLKQVTSHQKALLAFIFFKGDVSPGTCDITLSIASSTITFLIEELLHSIALASSLREYLTSKTWRSPKNERMIDAFQHITLASSTWMDPQKTPKADQETLAVSLKEFCIAGKNSTLTVYDFLSYLEKFGPLLPELDLSFEGIKQKIGPYQRESAGSLIKTAWCIKFKTQEQLDYARSELAQYLHTIFH